ncbi:hypothetical protein LTR51_005936 [Lithohypha guttulata]|nr:hypothetical protein LTR51_005936 [Lithohypha guttulata]
MDVKAEIVDTFAEPGDEFFWFRVGSKRQFFQVERSLIEPASPIIASKIKDQVNSAEENTADLPDIEPSTFEVFLTFARSMKSDYTTGRASENELQLNPSPELGQLIVLLLDSGQTHSNVRIALRITHLDFRNAFQSAMPVCKQTVTSVQYQTFPLALSQAVPTPQSMFNNCCLAPGAPALLRTSPEHINEDTNFFRFDVPILAKEVASTLRSSASGVIVMVSDVLELAKLCVLGDRYEVPQLKRVAIFALFEELAWCDLWKRPQYVVQLVDYIYDNTADSGFSSQYNTKHILRRMISCYVAFHARELQSFPAMAAVLCSGREVSSDVFMASTRISAGGDKE